MIRPSISLLIFTLMFKLSGCGGKVQDSVATDTVNPSGTGGTASVGPNTNGGTVAGGTSSNTNGGMVAGGTSSNTNVATLSGGTSSTGNVSSTGMAAVQASGGTCSTNNSGLTHCSMHSGGGQSTFKASSGDNVCFTAAGTYVIGSTFAGYAFAFISLSENLGDILSCSAGGAADLCFSGQVAATDSNFVPVAALGVNLNQSQAVDSPVNAIPYKVNSVTVDARNKGSGNLRIQINQGTTYYCSDITGDSGPITIYAEQFNTQCWDNSGTYWDGTGAIGVQLTLVNPNERNHWNFSVCLDSLSIQ